jgi:hypothetical protein
MPRPLQSELAYTQHRDLCWACQAVDNGNVPGAKRCPEGKQKVRAADQEWREENSEFGHILGDIHDGNVILSSGNPERRDDGTVVWVSSAFNPLTSDQLRAVADYMDEQQWKSI